MVAPGVSPLYHAANHVAVSALMRPLPAKSISSFLHPSATRSPVNYGRQSNHCTIAIIGTLYVSSGKPRARRAPSTVHRLLDVSKPRPISFADRAVTPPPSLRQHPLTSALSDRSLPGAACLDNALEVLTPP